MELLTSVTELLILAAASWAVAQALSEELVHQEELIPIPVKDETHPANR